MWIQEKQIEWRCFSHNKQRTFCGGDKKRATVIYVDWGYIYTYIISYRYHMQHEEKEKKLVDGYLVTTCPCGEGRDIMKKKENTCEANLSFFFFSRLVSHVSFFSCWICNKSDARIVKKRKNSQDIMKDIPWSIDGYNSSLSLCIYWCHRCLSSKWVNVSRYSVACKR